MEFGDKRIGLLVALEATLGGIRRHVVDLLLNIDYSRYDVTFVYSTKRSDTVFVSDLKRLREKGVRLIEISMDDGINIIHDVIGLFRLVRVIKHTHFDVIHLHGAKAGALGRVAALFAGKKKIIYTPHGGAFHKFRGIRGFFYLIIEKVLALKRAHYVGVSKHSCSQISLNLRVPPTRLHMIYNGIDADDFIRTSSQSSLTRRSLDLEDRHFVVLWPALFLEEKGHLEFLDAIGKDKNALDPEIVVLLVGDGPLRARITRRIQELGIENQFRILGFRDDIPQLMKHSDLIMLGSRNEAFAYVLVEAMALSKPILATSVGSIPEIVQDGYNGILIPKEQIDQFVPTLNSCYHDRERTKQMGVNGLSYIQEHFSLRKMISETEALYQSVNSGAHKKERRDQSRSS